MKKLLSVCIALLFIISAKAQPYKTMFPEGRKWIDLVTFAIGGYEAVPYSIEKDTLINGNSYKKIKQHNSFFREDVNSGKVWVLMPDCGPNEVLYMDYALIKGDTFPLKDYYPALPDTGQIVDTVYVKDGRKHIAFKVKSLYGEAFEFIEGIGSNYGFLYVACGVSVHQYLLCAQDNNVDVFSNKHFNGQCYPFGFPSAVKDIRAGEISIYPNPANDILTLSFAKQLSGATTYSIIDPTSRKVKSGVLEAGMKEYQVAVKELLPGMYQVIIGADTHIKFVKQ